MDDQIDDQDQAGIQMPPVEGAREGKANWSAAAPVHGARNKHVERKGQENAIGGKDTELALDPWSHAQEP